MQHVVVGRQPIFDRMANVHGYQLILQPSAADTGDVDATTGSTGSTDILVTANALFHSLTIGIDRMVGRHDLYVQVDPGILATEAPMVLPAERTVLGIRVGDADEVCAERCRQLRGQGYRLVVDHDVVHHDPAGLAGLATAIRIDVRTVGIDTVQLAMDLARRHHLTTIAANIDLRQELAECDELGFDLFQGHLLARPTLVSGTALAPGRVAALQLAATMLDSEVSVDELQAVIRRDPAMSHQLLALAGVGAAGGMRRTVRSLREALVLVGWRRLQSWAALLMVADNGRQQIDEEMTLALVRARACELLAQSLMPEQSDAAFTAGMLSALDLLLHIELADALAFLPLDPQLSEAIVHHRGPVGQLVADVIDLQFGRFDQAVRSGLDPSAAQRAMFQALTWSVQATTALGQRQPEEPALI